MNPLLSIHHLNAYYGTAHCLHDISLTINAGEVLAIEGHHGAGKSTLLKAIIGLTQGGLKVNQACQMVWNNVDIASEPSYRRAARGIGFVPEDRRIFGGLSVLENLTIAQRTGDWTLEKIYALFPNLKTLSQQKNRLGQHISGGEQKMLSIARTLMAQPTLILLDEPSEGVAPIIVQQMITAIVAIKSSGVAIMLSEQNTAFIREVADNTYRLEKGVLQTDATPLKCGLNI